MSDPQRPKPLPARPPADKVAPAPAPVQPAPAPPVRTPPEEVEVVGRGGTWIAQVLGRSGRAAARSAPLMLLGFREKGSASEGHSLEATVPARWLADLTAEALEAALHGAKAPPPGDQRRPFFEDADPTRRSGPASEY